MSEPGWARLQATRPKLTRRALLQLGLGGLLYLGGANAAAGWVVVLAAALLGTVPWAWVSVWRAGRSVEARRSAPARAVAGGPVGLGLEVRAATGAHAVVHDGLAGASGATGGLRAGALLRAGAPLRRGAVRSGEVEVVLSDLLGLVTVTAREDVPVHCDVLPAVPAITAGPWMAAWAAQTPGASTRAGHGTEVLGVREYRHGDPPKVIHWRSTARQGRLMARELATDAQPRLRLVIGAGLWHQAALDRAAEAVSALGESARASGHPVDVGVDGSSVPWGPAARHHLAMLPPHTGAAARPLGGPPPGDADVVVTFSPAENGVHVAVTTPGGGLDLGILASDTDAEGVSSWLDLRTRRSAA